MERIGMDATHKPDDRWLGGLAPVTIATWIWMTGAIVVSCYVLIGHFAARRFYRTTRSLQSSWTQEAQQLAKELGFNRTLRIVESDRVSVPIVLQLWQPIIVIPTAATNGHGPAFVPYCFMNSRTSNGTTCTCKALLSLRVPSTGSILWCGLLPINCVLSVSKRATTLYFGTARAERTMRPICSKSPAQVQGRLPRLSQLDWPFMHLNWNKGSSPS